MGTSNQVSSGIHLKLTTDGLEIKNLKSHTLKNIPPRAANEINLHTTTQGPDGKNIPVIPDEKYFSLWNGGASLGMK